MKILFLGTGADDWVQYTGEKSGEYRGFSSILIDDVLLIDPGPSVLEAAERFSCDLSKVKYILNTHNHRDHFNQENVDYLTNLGAEFIPFADGDIKQVGNYTIEAVEANHNAIVDTVHFLIDDGESRIFYGLDGAWLLKKEVEAIRRQHVDLAILDGTIGDVPGDFRVFVHNNLHMVEEMKCALEPFVDRFVITHMAYTLHTDHQTLVERLRPSGIEAAYDGWVLELKE